MKSNLDSSYRGSEPRDMNELMTMLEEALGLNAPPQTPDSVKESVFCKAVTAANQRVIDRLRELSVPQIRAAKVDQLARIVAESQAVVPTYVAEEFAADGLPTDCYAFQETCMSLMKQMLDIYMRAFQSYLDHVRFVNVPVDHEAKASADAAVEMLREEDRTG